MHAVFPSLSHSLYTNTKYNTRAHTHIHGHTRTHGWKAPAVDDRVVSREFAQIITDQALYGARILFPLWTACKVERAVYSERYHHGDVGGSYSAFSNSRAVLARTLMRFRRGEVKPRGRKKGREWKRSKQDFCRTRVSCSPFCCALWVQCKGVS